MAKSTQKPETDSASDSESIKQEVAKKTNQVNNNQVIESIQHYMSEIKKHREELRKKGIL